MIFLWYVFKIHRHIIDESLLDRFAKNAWIPAIRIEFDEKTHVFDFSHEFENIRLKCRLSSADDDSIEESYARLDEIQKNFFRDEVVHSLSKLLRKHELCIMTESTTKITSRRKNKRRETAWVIEECGFLDSGYEHE